MKTKSNQLVFFLRLFISALFFLSAFAKLYPTPIYGITKVFEEGQLIPMGFSVDFAQYLSRIIIGLEIFLAIAILFNNYLKKIVVPLAFVMITVFSIHLATQLFGDSENCGCFGELIPMTPLEALIKNIVTLFILAIIYIRSDKGINIVSHLVILFLLISTIIFAFIPISLQSNMGSSSFVSFVDDKDFASSEGQKILCFFDAGCEHCQHTARSLDSLSNLTDDFPPIYIIFSDAEKYKIPLFFEFTGREYPYQVMPFANYDTEDIDSYMEITFPDYDNPVVILYDGVRQLRLYEGTGEREFSIEDLQRILESKR